MSQDKQLGNPNSLVTKIRSMDFARISDKPLMLILLITSALLAHQLTPISMGQEFDGRVGRASPILLFFVIAGATLLQSLIAGILIARFPRAASSFEQPHLFRQFIFLLVTSVAAVALLLAVSPLFVTIFAAIGVVLGGLCIALPRRVYPAFSLTDMLQTAQAIWNHRTLLRLWLNFNIQTRYKQRVLGVLWIVLLPVATSFVIAFAFSHFMQTNIAVPFIAFYMSALVPYNFFANNLYGSTSSILGHVGIITQVYFPREILILLTLGEVFVDFLFAFAALLIINLFFGVFPNGYFVFLPLLFIVMLMLVMGLMLLISALAVVIRDIPQLLSVLLQLTFFLTPVIYPIEQVPDEYQFIFLINPLAPIVQGFRDVIAFNRPPDMVTLYLPLAYGIVFMCVGYAVFKAFENEMTDLL